MVLCKHKDDEIPVTGKTIIITGANTGIGKETALGLSERGARVILACRSLDKANAAAKEIREATKNEVVVKQLDLSSFASVRKFADEILTTEPEINMLINNAGLVAEKGTTEDGFDLTFQTNHLGPFLLTNLLLPKIKESGPARIVNLSSYMYRYVSSIPWDDLNFEKPGSYESIKAYSLTKLANLYFTQVLAEKLKDTNVTTYAVHPGYVESNLSGTFGNVAPGWMQALMGLVKRFTIVTPKDGAKTSLYCALKKDLEKESGSYYSDSKRQSLASIGKDKEAAKRLWDVSEKMVKLEKEQSSSNM